LRFLSRLLETAGLSIVISRRTLLHFNANSGGTYTFKQTIRPHDRQCNVVAHARGLFVPKKVGCSRGEELHRDFFVEGRGIRYINDHCRAL
jgi:hypothetical protein